MGFISNCVTTLYHVQNQHDYLWMKLCLNIFKEANFFYPVRCVNLKLPLLILKSSSFPSVNSG